MICHAAAPTRQLRIYNLLNGEIEFLAPPPLGTSDSDSIFPSLSGDGRIVVYANIGFLGNVFLRDAPGHQIFLESRLGFFRQGGASSLDFAGRVVAYELDGDILLLDGGIKKSATNTPTPDPEFHRSFAPKLSLDGSKLAFISERRLDVAQDPDNDRDIYVREIATGVLQLIPSTKLADALAISGDGRLLAYTQGAKAFVRKLATGEVADVSAGLSGPNGLGSKARIAISGDGRFVAFDWATRTGTNSSGDSVPLADVFVASVSFAAANRPPAVTLSVQNEELTKKVADGATLVTGAKVVLTAFASDPDGAVRNVVIKVDGRTLATSDTSAVSFFWTLSRGVHRIVASAVDDRFVSSDSAPLTLIVPDSQAPLTDVLRLEKTTQPDQSVSFQGDLRVDNASAKAAAELRIVVWESSLNVKLGLDSDFSHPPTAPPELPPQIIGIFPIPGKLKANGFSVVPVNGQTSIPLLRDEGDNGTGWRVTATIEVKRDGTWLPLNTLNLFDVLPAVSKPNEQNGGIPLVSSGRDAPAFSITNPPPETSLVALTIRGPKMVKEGKSARYRAYGTFRIDNIVLNETAGPFEPPVIGSIHTAPILVALKSWSVEQNALSKARIAISQSGDLRTPAVAQDTSATITANYEFGGITRSASFPITVLDIPFGAQAGNYNGLVGVGALSDIPSGFFTLLLVDTGQFTARIQIDGRTYPVRGRLELDGTFQTTMRLSGGRAVTVELRLPSAESTQIAGSITLDGQTLAFAAEKHDPNAHSAVAGRYTLAFPRDGSRLDAAYPQGNGYAAVTVNASGRVRAAGVLGDGTKFTQAALLSKELLWPFFIAPYAKQGAVGGSLSLQPGGPDAMIDGALFWAKPRRLSGKDAFYADGFEGTIATTGARYTQVSGEPVIALDRGQLAIGGGDLTSTLEKEISIEGKNRVTIVPDEQFTLRFATATGLFSGQFRDPAGKLRGFNGAVLRQSRTGIGMFLGIGPRGQRQTGYLEIGP